MQIVYISNRPALLRDTLSSVARFMRFVNRAVVVVPENLHTDFSSLSAPFPLQIVHDEALTGTDAQAKDHQARDYLLRTRLTAESIIDDEFIMSDDDYRPLRAIEPAMFKEKEKYHSYFFYDLKNWTACENDFDIGQQNTFQVLKHLKYPHYSFASHMPQVINKGILAESAVRFKRYSEDFGLCEWSTYFNFAHSEHPGLFHAPSVYKTLCWPDCATCWPKSFEPNEYLFENVSPGLYKENGPFADLNQIGAEGDDGFGKILCWYKHELRVRQGQVPDYPSWFKKVVYKLIRPIRRLYDVISLQDRGRLLALSERVESIENAIENTLTQPNKYKK